MTELFRLALVGIDHPHGFGWRQTLSHFHDQVAITAIVPGFGGATCSLEESLADVPRFQTVDELLTRGRFDGAVVCLPNDENPGVLVQLANAGKHILAEKPAAKNAEDFAPVINAVEQAGIAYQAGYMWRYDPLVERMRRMVADDQFGHLISLEMTFVTSDIRRRGPEHYLFQQKVSGAGFFNWLACHYLDLLSYVAQRSVVSVTARTGQLSVSETEVEDGGIVILELEGGAMATFIGGYWIPRWAGESRWCVRGSERWVHWEPGRPETGGALEIHGPKPQWMAMDETFVLPPDETLGYGGQRNVTLVQDWLDAAREGGRPCRNTPRSTHATLALIDTIYEASRKRRTLELG